jgi:carbon storage regulator
MLVLSRKHGEGIIIGEGIEVVVLGSHGNKVRLGLKAPEGVRIHRQEVALRIEKEEAREQERSLASLP